MVVFKVGLQTEAVVFDFDGVIVDTEPLHYSAFQHVLKPLDLGFSWEEYEETYMGFDDRDAFSEAFQSKGLPLEHNRIVELVAKKAMCFQQIIEDGNVRPYPGVLDLIAKLRDKGVPLAIASGALRSDIIPILSKLQILESFPILVTADMVKTSKPNPESYILATRMLSEQYPYLLKASVPAMAIEDTPAGIEAAKGAGLQVVSVTNSYAPNKLHCAHCLVESLEDLLDFVIE